MKDYNDELVEYCGVCKSLHLVEEDNHVICMNCGSVDYSFKAHIEFWLKKYGSKRAD